jgi:hypothetical protein
MNISKVNSKEFRSLVEENVKLKKKNKALQKALESAYTEEDFNLTVLHKYENLLNHYEALLNVKSQDR